MTSMETTERVFIKCHDKIMNKSLKVMDTDIPLLNLEISCSGLLSEEKASEDRKA